MATGNLSTQAEEIKAVERVSQNITDIGSPEANSYLTIAEADEYLSSRDGFDKESWEALSEDSKALRLILGTMAVDSLNFRGARATRTQALAFPRVMPGEPLYVEDSETGEPFRHGSWELLVDYAALKRVDAPVIPQAVKSATMEIVLLPLTGQQA
jgi:hypothetical protein